jgi:hypothetical protein
VDGVLHVSLRVSDPQRSAELLAELLDGEICPTPLARWGVVCMYVPGPRESWLRNMLEFWPPDKHWRHGQLIDIDPKTHGSYGHIALLSSKGFQEMKPIVERFGFVLREEERGMPGPVPVLYDDLGNYYEFFPRTEFELE